MWWFVVVDFIFCLFKHKGQSVRQDRNRNWPAENLAKTIWCGVIHHAILSLLLFTHTLNRDSQKAALPIFVAVCPPVLYSGTLTKLRV